MLTKVVTRVLQEKADEDVNKEYRSEPVPMLLHGVPGAGKSRVLKWMRIFFEEVCDFTHGVEFVYLASQNTMAALSGGSTPHSFGDIPFMTKGGDKANLLRCREQKKA